MWNTFGPWHGGTAKLGTFPVGFRGIRGLALTSPPCPSKPTGCKQEEAHLLNTTRLPGNSPVCLLYTSPSPRDRTRSRMPSSA